MRITFITNPHTCNQNCSLCFSKQAPLDWEPVQEMDFAIIEKTIEAFLPLGLKEIIPSTIGEPFLYSHFEDFLKLAKKHSLKVNITTNGTFPKGGIKKWLPLLLPVLSDIKFSAMRGKIPESVAEFIRGVESKEWGVDNKPTITVQATLDDGDKLDEIPAGIDRVKINKPWFLNRPLPTPHSLLPANCAFLTKELWVWVDGTFQVCPNPDARFGMQTRTPFGDFGNFAKQDPLAIWNGSAYKKFCENYQENPICKKCKMRHLNQNVTKKWRIL
ncbi:MAG: radical SAM protein [Fibromonadaceae bacterium]|jgi:MoaA/NifB/PqqE/SkfB family radical SAM enzyme|nr:radical SAM protein [Fibromonadaceae bacterium]